MSEGGGENAVLFCSDEYEHDRMSEPNNDREGHQQTQTFDFSEGLVGYAIQSDHSIRLNTVEEFCPSMPTRACSISTNTCKNKTQQSLARIYESYSHQFPSQRVLNRRHRESELKAQAIAQSRPRVRAGLFARLFASHDTSTGNTSSDVEVTVDGDVTESGQENIEDKESNNEDKAVYVPLLETDFFDWRVIPPEAHHCARLYLSSIRPKASGSSSCLHVCKFGEEPNHEQRSVWVVVGIGQLVEMPLGGRKGVPEAGSRSQPSSSSDPVIVETNDREMLLEAYNRYAQTPIPQTSEPHMEFTRCVQLSTNCIAITWGFDDGVIVIYRRVQLNNRTFEWHHMACVTALSAVVNSVGRLCTGAIANRERKQPAPSAIFQSGLLRISDMAPLHLGSPQSGHKIILTVARLGGYLEFIVVPNDLCQGPILAPNPKSKGKGRRGEQEHYAAGLPNVSADGRLNHTWVPTLDHHTDIMAMNVVKTNVSEDCTWDETAFPDAPPAEYIICTTGFSNTTLQHEMAEIQTQVTSGDNDRKLADNPKANSNSITLWGFTLLQESLDENDFNMIICPLLTMDLDEIGPDVTTFVSNTTVSNWNDNDDHPLKGISSTITTSSPISSLQMTKIGTNGCLISVMDYNGGVTVLDCSDVFKNATHEVGFIKSGMSTIYRNDEMYLSNQNITSNSNGGRIVDFGWWLSPSCLYLATVLEGGQVILRTVHPDSNTMKYRFHVVGWVTVSSEIVGFVDRSQITHGNINLLNYSNSDDNGCVLSLFSIGRLHPRHYLNSLIIQKRFDEALELSSKYNLKFENETVMDECYIHSWETNLDVDAFKKITNHRYVRNQACDIEELVRSNPSMTLSIIGEVLWKGLENKAVSPPNDDAYSRIQNGLVRLGTYTLISKILNLPDPSPKRFVRRFLKMDIVDIVKSFATHGDTRCVTLMVVRHWEDLCSSSVMQEILDFLPFSASISDYEILIPRTGSRDITQHWNEIILDAEMKHDSVLFCDEADKSLIYSTRKDNLSYGTEFDVMGWCFQRAQEMANCFGSLDTVVLLLNKAVELFDTTNDEVDNDSMLQIVSLRASTFHVHCLLELGIHLDDELLERIQGMSIKDFEILGVKGVISLILRGCHNSDETIFRYKHLLRPMFCDDGVGTDYIIRCWPDLITGQESLTTDRRKELEIGTVLFCLENVQNAVDEDIAYNCVGCHSTLIALSLCEAVAKSSSTEIPAKDRLVDNVLFHMQFVLDVAKIVGDNLTSPDVVTKLWQLYEFLPTSQISESGNNGLMCLSQSVDILYRSLVAIQISLRWSSGESCYISLGEMQQFYERQASSSCDNDRTFLLEEISERLLKLVCTGFSKQIFGQGGPILDGLFLEFLSDIVDMNAICFNKLAPVVDVFEEYLIGLLLQQTSFLALRKFLLAQKIKNEAVATAIVAFATDIAFRAQLLTKDEDMQILQECIDCFALLLPDCCPELHDAHQFIAATSFMTEILNCDVETIPTFDAFKKASRISIITDTMQTNPNTIIFDCPQWKDPSFSFDMLVNMSQQLKMPPDGTLPPLPLGDPILHLANLLGLGDPRSQFFVKNCITGSAVKAGLHGAAAALCSVMLHSAIIGLANGQQMDAEAEEALLASVASVVSSESNINGILKIGICQDCIRWQNCNNRDNAAFHRILLTYTLLKQTILTERNLSSANAVSRTNETENNNEIVFADMLSIVKTFGEVNQPDVYDFHMEISHYVANQIIPWCAKTLISKATSCQNKNGILKVLRLAIAILLDGNNIVLSLNSVESCVLTIENMYPTDTDFKQPADEHIVAQLIHRGYTIHGARRAAIMSKNESVSAAMVWAVGHATDPNFNDPLVILHNENEVNISEANNGDAIITARSLLLATKAYLGERNLKSINGQPTSNAVTQKSDSSTGGNGVRISAIQINGESGYKPIQPRCDDPESRSMTIKRNSPDAAPIGLSSEIRTSSHHQNNPRMIVVPVQKSTDLRNPDLGKKSLVEGGRQLLQNRRQKLRRSNRLQLAAQGRLLLEQAKGRPTTNLNSGSSRGSTISVISSFTHTAGENVERECDKIEACDDEESLTGFRSHFEIQKNKNDSNDVVGIPFGVDTGLSRMSCEGSIGISADEKKMMDNTEIRKRDKVHEEATKESERQILITKMEASMQAESEAVAEAEILRLAAKEQAEAQVEARRKQLAAEAEAETEKLRLVAREEARLVAEAASKTERIILVAEEKARLQAESGRLRLAAEEEARLAAEIEAQRLRLADEEETRLQAEAESLRLVAEEEARLAAEAERLKLAAEEEARVQAEAEALRLRLAAEEEARLRLVAEENARVQAKAERLRMVAEEEARLAVEAEALRLRLAAEDEARVQGEAESLRLAAEEEARLAAEVETEAERLRLVARLAAEEEARLAAEVEAERLRLVAEEEARLQAKAESLRLATEEEARLAAEAERLRFVAEEEARLQAEDEASRLRVAAVEKARLKSVAEEEARLTAEAERLRLVATDEARVQAEAESLRLATEEEAKLATEVEAERLRLVAEDEARVQAEAESLRLAAKEEARLATESEAERLKLVVAEKARVQAESESLRLAAEEEARLAAEAERLRLVAEEEARVQAEAKSLILAAGEEARLAAEAETEKLRLAAEEEARFLVEAEVEHESMAVKEEARLLAVAEAQQQRISAEEEVNVKDEVQQAEAESLRLSAEEDFRAQAEAEAESLTLAVKKEAKVKAEEETEKQRITAEEEAIIQAEAEAKAERLRLLAEAEAEQHRIAAKEEARLVVDAEAERLKMLAAKEARIQTEAEDEQQRIAAEEEARLIAEAEAERLKLRAEEEAEAEAEAERLRLLAEAESRLHADAEAEQQRIAAEEEARLVAEAEAEAERLKLRAEEEAEGERLKLARLHAEAEIERLRLLAEEEARTQAEAEAERLTLAEEEARMYADVEAERLRLLAEEEARSQAEAKAEAERLSAEEETRFYAEVEAERLSMLTEEEAVRLRLAAEQKARMQAEVEAELAVKENIMLQGEDKHNNGDNLSLSLDDLCADDGWGFDADSVEALEEDASDIHSEPPPRPEGKVLRSGRLLTAFLSENCSEKQHLSVEDSGSTSWSYEDVTIGNSTNNVQQFKSVAQSDEEDDLLDEAGDDGWGFDC